MIPKNRFDLIIAGAGAAGLSLFLHLCNSPVLRRKKILLIDKNLSPSDDKTWCFWDYGRLPVSEYIYHSWNRLNVSVLDQYFTETLQKYTYHCIRSADYSSQLLSEARKMTNVELIEADIHGFSPGNDEATVLTSKGNYSAPWIFQSAIKPNQKKAIVDISLLQHFTGWEIETSRDLFNPAEATFMDFEKDQQNGISFFYLLPFSKRKALIEYTLFSEQVLNQSGYENKIKTYIQSNLGLKINQFKILRVEKGVIPMEDKKYSREYCSRVLNIGTVGGLTKPTTGYTFSRIHDMCFDIIRNLENNAPIKLKPPSSYRFRVYDLMLLYLLKNEVSQSIRIFHDLFKKNSFEKVLRFLDEDTSFPEELSIFSKMPYRPFLRSVYKMKHRIFTGA